MPETEKPKNVRLATPADEDALFDLLIALHDDNAVYGVGYEEDVVRETIRKATEKRGSIIGVIDGRQGLYGESSELAGAVCLTLAKFWYSSQDYLAELFLFVRPDYRSNHLERDLFKYSKWCGEQMSDGIGHTMPTLTSVSSLHRLPAKMRLWSRYGKHIGAIYRIL